MSTLELELCNGSTWRRTSSEKNHAPSKAHRLTQGKHEQTINVSFCASANVSMLTTKVTPPLNNPLWCNIGNGCKAAHVHRNLVPRLNLGSKTISITARHTLHTLHTSIIGCLHDVESAPGLAALIWREGCAAAGAQQQTKLVTCSCKPKRDVDGFGVAGDMAYYDATMQFAASLKLESECRLNWDSILGTYSRELLAHLECRPEHSSLDRSRSGPNYIPRQVLASYIFVCSFQLMLQRSISSGRSGRT